MAVLSENEIVSRFIGCDLNADHLARCAHRNGSGKEPAEYIVYSCGFLYDRELRNQFGVTDELKDLWERRGTEFNVYVYISDNRLVSCQILKYTESGGARPTMSTPKSTQQELRIARRILEYLVEA